MTDNGTALTVSDIARYAMTTSQTVSRQLFELNQCHGDTLYVVP